ncbi:MAG: phage tail tape measure protein [Aestuariivirga sp.]|uniref:phage tail tape measure protein n=1 Tax=Aestuariivirga sp. TaxID=2650926 RepID=UPI0025C051D3|nr:phage tail tape measure protein [Aestuariivirga sp.]MCA3559935.1 phage tail tape measure protein [Aestuariivirga sp.]
MASITSQLIVSLLDQVTGPARRVANSLRGITRTVKEAASGTIGMSDRLDAAITRNNRAMDAARGRMLDAVGTLYILRSALGAPVRAAQEFDRALAEIGAKGNLTAEQMTAIGEAAKQTSSHMNQFATDIVRAQDFLVGMGLDVERATRAMPSIARAATATGASLEDLSKAGFAAMANLGLAAEDLGKSFDVMAAAGKAGGFELRDMAQYLPSITALANSKGITGGSGLAQIAGALQIVRRGAGDASEAATNFSNILQKINSNDAIGNFKDLGIDIQKVLKDARANGTDPLEASLRAINTALGGDMSRLGELFADAQVQKGLIPLLTGLEDYIRLRDEAAKADGVISADFARMMQTSVEQVKQFQIALQNFQTSIGAALVPVLGGIAGALKPVLELLTAIVNQYPGVSGALVAITAGFVALRAALAGLTFIGLMGKGGLLASLAFGLRGLTAALAALRAVVITAPLGMLASGLTSLRGSRLGLTMLGSAGGLKAVAGTLGSSLLGLLNPLRLVTAAAVALRGALMLTGVGAILIGIAVAGKFIYDNWQGIKEMFAAFGEAFMAALGPVRPMLDPVISGVSSLFGWMSRLSLEIAPGTWRQWGAAAGTAIGNVVRWFAELPGRIAAAVGSLYELGRQMMQSFFDGIVSVANDLLNYVSGIGSRIRSALSFGGAEGVSSDPMGTGVIDGQRAKGGPISRGSTYLVGERGPELITAGRSGYVNRAGSFPAGGITVAPVFHMTFNGTTDSEDVVQQIRRVLRDEVRETFRGVFADTSMRFA